MLLNIWKHRFSYFRLAIDFSEMPYNFGCSIFLYLYVVQLLQLTHLMGSGYYYMTTDLFLDSLFVIAEGLTGPFTAPNWLINSQVASH